MPLSIKSITKNIMNRLILILALIISAFQINAQNKMNLGLSISAIKGTSNNQALLIQNGTINQKLSRATSTAFQVGAFVEFQLGSFYIQPEVLYGRESAQYIAEVSNSLLEDRKEMILKERTQYIEVPLSIGFRFGSFKLEAGPVLKHILSIDTELDQLDGFNASIPKRQLGLQGGIGVRLNKHIDLEFNFKNFMSNAGDHMSFYDEPTSFYSSPSSFELKAVVNLFASQKKIFPSFKDNSSGRCNRNSCFSF